MGIINDIKNTVTGNDEKDNHKAVIVPERLRKNKKIAIITGRKPGDLHRFMYGIFDRISMVN